MVDQPEPTASPRKVGRCPSVLDASLCEADAEDLARLLGVAC